MEGVIVTTSDYLNRQYDRFYVGRDSIQPGWFVFGMNPGYGDRLRMICAYPDKPARKFRYRNCKLHAGWRTKGEALDIASRMNQGER